MLISLYQMEVFRRVVSQVTQVHPIQLRENVERNERSEALTVGRDLMHCDALVLHRYLRLLEVGTNFGHF